MFQECFDGFVQISVNLRTENAKVGARAAGLYGGGNASQCKTCEDISVVHMDLSFIPLHLEYSLILVYA